MKKKILLVGLLMTVFLTSCFRRWVMTEKQLTNHYKNEPLKPNSHTIENDSIKLHFVTLGADTAQPILFIHGAPGSWSAYLNLLDDTTLQKHFQLISVDRLGYGKSQKEKSNAIYSIEKQANAIVLALNANHSHKKVIVVGKSYGVPIAAKIGAMFPKKVQKLILLSPAIDPDKEKFWWFSKLGKQGIVRLFLPKAINTATDEKFSHTVELRKLVPDWQKIQVPVTVVQGGKDWIIDSTNFSFAKKMLQGKNAKFIFLPEASHAISASNPELVKREILN